MKNAEQLKKTGLLPEILEESKTSLKSLKNEVEGEEPSLEELKKRFDELANRARNLDNRYKAAFPNENAYPRVTATADIIRVKNSKIEYLLTIGRIGNPVLKIINDTDIELSVEGYKEVLNKIGEALDKEENIVNDKEKRLKSEKKSKERAMINKL